MEIEDNEILKLHLSTDNEHIAIQLRILFPYD